MFPANLIKTRPATLRRRKRAAAPSPVERLEPRWVPAALTYNNGPLLANVQLQAVYYAPWNTTPSLQTESATLNSYLSSLATGTYIPSLLSQYSVTTPTAYSIGTGSALAPDTNFPTPSVTTATLNDGNTYTNVITDGSIRTMLAAELAANRLTNNANTLYVVFTPPGDPVQSGSQDSIKNFFAYHWEFTNAGKTINYAVLPYPGSPNATYNPLTNLQLTEEAASHEIAEAITDPASSNNGWTNASLGGSGEIGDLANLSYSTLNGYVVQNEFSNAVNGAAVATGTNFYISSFSNPYNGQFNGVIGTFVDTSGGGNLSATDIDWGDGTPQTSLTVQRVNATTFNLIGSHDYTGAIGTQYNLNIWLTLADGSQAHSYGQINIKDSSNVNHAFNNLGLVTLQDAPLTPVAVPTLSGTEGQTLSNVLVGSFTDPGGDGTTTAYTATITWDDGGGNSHTSTGRVSFEGGTTYDVFGDNTTAYLEEGVHNVKVAVNDSGGSTTTLTDTVNVADPAIVATGGFTVTATEGNPALSQVVATFTDPGGPEAITDYSATIDWGNGTVSAGTITGPVGGVFSVLASGNVYVDEDIFQGVSTNPITVTISHESTVPQTVTDSARIIDPPLIAAAAPLPATPQGSSTGTIPLATFTDPGGSEPIVNDPSTKFPAHYSATVDWGDGTLPNHDIWDATITEFAGTFTVSSSHIYLAPGLYPVTVTIMHENTVPQVVHDTILVTEQDLISVSGDFLSGNPGQSLGNVEVATFTDGYPFTYTGVRTTATNYAASINWGDGTVTGGTIAPNNVGGYSVTGNHTYATAGFHFPSVTVSRNGEPNDFNSGDATVYINPTSVTPSAVTVSATEGQSYTGRVATITTNDWTLQSSNFSATIIWGNGATSTGTVSGSNGQFTVSGANTYTDEGSYPVSVKLVERLPASPPTAVLLLSTVNVQEGDVLTPHGTSLSATVGTALSGVLATFTDTYTGASSSGFHATINWGDGAMTSGTVGGSGGTFSVSGSHTYGVARSYVITITLADTAPGTASSVATSAVTVAAGPSSVRPAAGNFVVVIGSTTDSSDSGTKRKGS